MECLGCGYDHRGSPAGPCPECGRAFDPADPKTYGPRGLNWFDRHLLHLSLIASAMPLVWLVLLHVNLVAARITLGRWPNRSGADDPKHIGGLAEAAYMLTVTAWLLIPIGIICNVVLVLAGAARGRWRTVAFIFAVFFSIWAVVIAIGDPADAILWFFD
jgi:hypothetical protein